MTVSIRKILTDDTLELRQRVLWPDKPLGFVRVPKDETAWHLGAFDGGDLIGVASFFPDGTEAQLRKLAVDPCGQGKGIGTQLVRAGIDLMRENGIKTLWCDARQTATEFYIRLGFEIDEAVFDKSGVAYQRAEKTL